MGNSKLHQLPAGSIRMDANHHVRDSRAANNLDSKKHQRMIDLLTLTIAGALFVWSFFFGDINQEAETSKNVILAIITVITLSGAAVRIWIKAITEIKEFREKYKKKIKHTIVKRERV